MKKQYRIVDLDSNRTVANCIPTIVQAHDLLKLYVADYPCTAFTIETYYTQESFSQAKDDIGPAVDA